MGDRMNGVMNHRRGGVLQKMIMRTDPVITGCKPNNKCR